MWGLTILNHYKDPYLKRSIYYQSILLRLHRQTPGRYRKDPNQQELVKEFLFFVRRKSEVSSQGMANLLEFLPIPTNLFREKQRH